jgi:hypothetical protein
MYWKEKRCIILERENDKYPSVLEIQIVCLIASCSQMKSFVFFSVNLDCFTLASGYPLASPSTRLEPMHTQYSIHIRNSSHCRQNLGYERVINSGVFFHVYF